MFLNINLICLLFLFVNLNIKVNSKEIIEFDDEQSRYIGEEFLEVLGIPRPSRMIHKQHLRNSAIEFLLELYEDMKEDTIASKKNNRFRRNSDNFVTKKDLIDVEECNNVMTFLCKSIDKMHHAKKNSLGISFGFEDMSKDLFLKKAELKIYKKRPKGVCSPDENTLQINVFLLSNQEIYTNYPIVSLNISITYHGWIEIDITNILYIWLLEKIDRDLGFFITTDILGDGYNNECYENVEIIASSGKEKFKPFILGYFNGPELIIPTKKHRYKRAMDDYSILIQREQLAGTCQRKNLTVDFHRLGWDWIIAPDQFDAFYCSGECNFPLAPPTNPTNHAIVQTLMHLKHSLLPKPQCAPIKLSSISVIFYVNEYIINHKTFRQIVAQSCGCQ